MMEPEAKPMPDTPPADESILVILADGTFFHPSQRSARMIWADVERLRREQAGKAVADADA